MHEQGFGFRFTLGHYQMMMTALSQKWSISEGSLCLLLNSVHTSQSKVATSAPCDFTFQWKGFCCTSMASLPILTTNHLATHLYPILLSPLECNIETFKLSVFYDSWQLSSVPHLHVLPLTLDADWVPFCQLQSFCKNRRKVVKSFNSSSSKMG